MRSGVIISLAFFFGMWAMSWPSSSQSPTLTYVKRIDEHRILIKVDGVEHLALDLVAVKEMQTNKLKAEEAVVEISKLSDSLRLTQNDLKLAQTNLQDCKNNVQDERVKYASLRQDFVDRGTLLTQCMTLAKQGGRVNDFLNKWPVRLTTEVVIPAVQTARCSR